MFSVTALGHQGWLLGTSRTHVLIDPILTPRFTRMPLSAPRVFPPRAMDFAAFPAIDAVLLTHEHPDHLDFVSLQHLDRSIPVYLSAHSSQAARRTIASLGFEVRSLEPGRPCVLGEIDVLPLPPYVIGEPGENEVDIVPVLARDREGHGNFFTSVDIVQVPEMVHEVRRHLDRPGIWTHANNAFAQSSFFEWCPRVNDPVDEAAGMLARRYASLFEGWGHPEITLVNGDGLTLGRDLAPSNPHVFDVSSRALVAALEAMLPGHAFRAVEPGTVAEMRDGVLVAVRDDAPFVRVDHDAPTVERGGAPFPGGTRPPFGPGTGKTSLDANEIEALERALDDFGRFLFARASYRGVFRLMAERHHDAALRQTFALALRHGDGGALMTWEFHPASCSFVRVVCDDPRATYVAGAEFWASDVLAALTFRAFADDLFHFGRKRIWNAAPDVFRCDLDVEIQLYAHPLRASRELAALYRTCLSDDAPVSILGSKNIPNPADTPRIQPSRRAPRLRPIPAAISMYVSSAPPPVGAQPGSARERRNDEAAPTPSEPVDPETTDRLARAVAEASQGTWALASTERHHNALRLSMTLPDGSRISLEAAPVHEMPRYYRRTASRAFSYSPAHTPEGALAVLDRVIVAVDAVESPRSETSP